MKPIRILMQLVANFNLFYIQGTSRVHTYMYPLSVIFIFPSLRVTKMLTIMAKNLVWKLNRSLYSLKQSSRNWHNDFIIDMDFVQCN